MSGAHEQSKRRRSPRWYLITTDLKVQDQLEGTIRLEQGNMCVEMSDPVGLGRSRVDQVWVKVIDNGLMMKLERHFLVDVPCDFCGLLEPVTDPGTRYKLLLNDPGKLQRLAAVPLGTRLWAQIGQPDELAEAELRHRGPLTRGSSCVLFGVQLKGSAVGRGVSNGSYKGHQLFVCPDAAALFLPVSHIRLRQWSSSGGGGASEHERVREPRESRRSDGPGASYYPANNNHSQPSQNLHHQPPSSQPPSGRSPQHRALQQQLQLLSRTADSVPLTAQGPSQGGPGSFQVRGPASPPPFREGDRVCFPLEHALQGGEVRYCGPLPGRNSSGMYVGILLDAPVGNWDGFHKGEKLCHIPSPLYGEILPIAKVSPESKSRLTPKFILKAVQQQPPVPKPSPTTSPQHLPVNLKVALMPPQLAAQKPSLKPPPLPPPKPSHKPSLPPPLHLPPKPLATASPVSPPADRDQPRPSNGAAHHGPPSPLHSPGNGDLAAEENGGGYDHDSGLGGGDLEVGSMVEVNDPPLFGVIRWIGRIGGVPELVAGIELDQELSAGTDGSYLGERHFRCPVNKGLFVKLGNCRRDSRFPAPETRVNQVDRCNSIAFAEWGSERVEEPTPPMEEEEAREVFCGWKRGIQGHLNSCYLDATLFSLFSCCSSADWVLMCPVDPQPRSLSCQAQDLLRCEIVNPLRRFGYVCASKTMALRRLLEADSSSDTGFTNQEKDPEEFLNRLFQLLHIEPLLKIRSTNQQPQEFHLYQLFPPSLPTSPSSPVPPLSPSSLSPISSPSAVPPSAGGRLRVASVQALLEASFHHAGLKFVEAPSCLLLLMPRFGRDFKMFDAILPSLSLDITDLLEDTLRQCSICQAVAEWECLQCYEDLDITPGRLKQYCHTCNTQVHSHRKRVSHTPQQVGVPDGPWPWPGPLCDARQQLVLFAVTCIETSHYVSFVKYGPRPADWLFFDSMADREGGENGFNIPQVRACPEVGRYLSLSEEEMSRIDPASLREPARRLLCDAHMCFYHSPELSLYK